MAIKILEYTLLLVLLVETGGADCPNGYLRHDSSCYRYYHGIQASWAEAQVYCELFNSKLAIISSAREQNFIQGLLRSEFRQGNPDGVWVDGTDSIVEGEWLWMGTSQLIGNSSYSNWIPGEPNDLGNAGEDCLELREQHQFMWNDKLCGYRNTFLCELSA